MRTELTGVVGLADLGVFAAVAKWRLAGKGGTGKTNCNAGSKVADGFILNCAGHPKWNIPVYELTAAGKKQLAFEELRYQ